ncbi:MAG: SpoIID/LytB domain-containing protein [Phycisphaeraceae bacterium]|nr:SpoIID/LytB domain-containing protein [Phycisphaeraceae bacterium]
MRRSAYALLLVMGLLLATSCRSTAPSPGGTVPGAGAARTSLDRVAPPLSSLHGEPMVRVRISSSAATLRFDAAGPLIVGPGPGHETKSQPRSFRSPLTVSRAAGAWMLRDAAGTSLRWALPTLAVECGSVQSGQALRLVNGNLHLDGHEYPGRIVLLAASSDPARIDAINHVPLETYLPGVLQHELYPKWLPAAYRAQAIAARSYSIVQLVRKSDQPYDMESTTASQVYGGRASNPTAIAAAAQTRGQVLTYQGRVVEAFYSSSSGGATQDATCAFVDRPGWFDIPPLRGRTHGWGTQATYYQWNPFSVDAATAASRMAQWGRNNRHAIAGLSGLRDVSITQRSGSGRPAQFTITDAAGRRYLLWAEQFRHAVNTGAPSDQQLRSSNVQVRVAGGRVQFLGGRGYGHGVGLDQWAAQDMAQRGHDERAILATFYHQAHISRAY